MSDEYSPEVEAVAAQLSKLTAEERAVTLDLATFIREKGLQMDFNNTEVLSEFIRLLDKHKAKA
jgi:hypothetical protein